MSDALHIFAEDAGTWSDRTDVAGQDRALGPAPESGNRLLALTAAFGAWSVVGAVATLGWLAFG